MKKNNILIIAALLQIQIVNAQWNERSSDFTAQRGIIDMAAPDSRNCYGVAYDAANFNNYLHEITVTHNGGHTWHAHTVDSLQDNWLLGIAAPSANTVHVIGWNFVNGGGNVFRSTDGGNTWEREAAGAFTDPASFPDNIVFFNARNGVIFGDPTNGSFEIYTTHNGGHSWSRVSATNIPAPLTNEYGLSFAADKYGNTMWAVTVIFNNDGTTSTRLLQTDDKGASWYVRSTALPLATFDVSIKFRNHSVGLYKNNGLLYRTTNGGTDWSQVNYSGTFFNFDFDNVPGLPGTWVSTGGDINLPTNSQNGIGSSVSFDDGDHWFTIDTAVNHTCVEMKSPFYGYTGGITSGSGNDGVFVYSFLGLKNAAAIAATNARTALTVYPNPSNQSFSLTLTAQEEIAQIRVYNMEGKLIMDQPFNPAEAFTFGNDFLPGLYQAEIYSGNEKHAVRIIKE